MTDNDPVEAALAVARTELAAPVPTGLVERAVAAALAAPRPRRTWWNMVLPTAWRAAVCVNAVAAVVVIWLLARTPPVARPDPIGRILADETSAVLATALRLPARTP